MESGTTETKDAVCVRRGRIAGYESGLCACVVPRLCIACPLFVRTALALYAFFAPRRSPPRAGPPLARACFCISFRSISHSRPTRTRDTITLARDRRRLPR